MTPYFAYGSNMSTPRLEQRVGPVRVLGRAWLDHYCHRFSKHGNDGTAKGNVEPDPGQHVWGVLFELESAQLECLRGFESGYRMVHFELTLEHRPVHAATFEALNVVRELAPSDTYIRHYIAGMREHAIPSHYRAALLADWPHLLRELDAPI